MAYCLHNFYRHKAWSLVLAQWYGVFLLVIQTPPRSKHSRQLLIPRKGSHATECFGLFFLLTCSWNEPTCIMTSVSFSCCPDVIPPIMYRQIPLQLVLQVCCTTQLPDSHSALRKVDVLHLVYCGYSSPLSTTTPLVEQYPVLGKACCPNGRTRHSLHHINSPYPIFPS